MFRDIPEIQIPVFVALGKYDYVIPYTLWQRGYKSIPDFTYVLFEKSGHTPQLEQTRKFDKELKKWLNKKG